MGKLACFIMVSSVSAEALLGISIPMRSLIPDNTSMQRNGTEKSANTNNDHIRTRRMNDEEILGRGMRGGGGGGHPPYKRPRITHQALMSRPPNR
jgi:hypothetical protein